MGVGVGGVLDRWLSERLTGDRSSLICPKPSSDASSVLGPVAVAAAADHTNHSSLLAAPVFLLASCTYCPAVTIGCF